MTKHTSMKKLANRKTRNRVRGIRKRTHWFVGNVEDRQALIDIGEACSRDWREGEPLITLRKMPRSLTPGCK